MKKFIIISILSLSTGTGILSTQTVSKNTVKPLETAINPTLSGFKKDLGSAD
ncbi:hypothetical protein [Mucilaginibacter sp. SP1R1]|uniref:hypothetical protein n=1 Tax=Mucilaginibacter sp. SP1R1 TaxID=2723091 RepID=UPI00161A9E41|nr:hypothetical protein [Mucilaginibacter sp. SP1R1]MBB6150618.1 hypothetical protein [Mucilaginibacter sp. SP1R1]